MDLGLLIVPALGGYLFLKFTYLTSFRIYRESGYHLVFSSASAGIFLFAFAYLVTPFIYTYYSSISKWLGLPAINFLMAALITTVLLGFALPQIINRIYPKEKAIRKTVAEKGNHIERIIEESYRNETWIELTLKNGKSYIGAALGFSLERGITGRNEADVALLPFLSGYRDRDTHKLRITTNYSSIIEEYLHMGESEEIDKFLRIAIPMSEIRSARRFDLEVYDRFQKQGRKNGG